MRMLKIYHRNGAVSRFPVDHVQHDGERQIQLIIGNKVIGTFFTNVISGYAYDQNWEDEHNTGLKNAIGD